MRPCRQNTGMYSTIIINIVCVWHNVITESDYHNFIYRWLDHVKQMMNMDKLAEDENLSWAAHHASCDQDSRDRRKSLSCLLPLFYEDSKSVAMLRHGMDIVKNAVDVLNPGQVLVIAADQPLYALCKQIQWRWPGSYGEDQFIVMFGGLHIEMNALKLLGDLLDSSGWTGALTQANIASSGTADSYLKVSHVTRTRHAHQVTASSLYILLHKAYTEYSSSQEDEETLDSLEAWCDERAKNSPQFLFWYTILQLELQVMIFVRSLRKADFNLYIEALSQLVPWFFSLDHRVIPCQINTKNGRPLWIFLKFGETNAYTEKLGHTKFLTHP